MSLPNAVATDTSVTVLASILNEIGAPERLQVFIDDGLDDDNLKNLSKMKPERISTVYGLSLDQAAAFADKCRSVTSSLDRPPPEEPVSHDDVLVPLALPPSPADDPSIMRMLNLEMIRE